METGALTEPSPKRFRSDEDDGATTDLRASFLERFFAKYEFTCKHMLSCSDSEAWQMSDVLDKADKTCKQLWDTMSLGYTESLGDPLLLQEIWARYRDRAINELRRRDPQSHPENISGMVPTLYTEQKLVRLTTCVPVEGIYATMRQLLEEKDVVICFAPAYQALYEIGRSKGCSIIQWKPRYNEEKNFWSFDVADLKALLEEIPCLKMLILNAPHNPTGAFFSQRQFDEISDILGKLQQKQRPILFSDEMYSDILPSRPSNIAKPNSIVLSGLSKPWGMPGLRVGWLFFENVKHFEKVTAYRDYTTLCLPPQSEVLSVIALRNANFVLERNRTIAKRNYLLLQTFLLNHPRWFYPLNQHEHNDALAGDDFAGVTLFARLKAPLGGMEGGQAPEYLKSIARLVEHLAQEHSICLVASDFFEFYEFPCVRFGIGRQNFAAALSSFGDALKTLI